MTLKEFVKNVLVDLAREGVNGPIHFEVWVDEHEEVGFEGTNKVSFTVLVEKTINKV